MKNWILKIISNFAKLMQKLRGIIKKNTVYKKRDEELCIDTLVYVTAVRNNIVYFIGSNGQLKTLDVLSFIELYELPTGGV